MLQANGNFLCFSKFLFLLRKVLPGRKIANSTLLADFFLDVARVAVVPGVEFGADPFERISFATSMENIEEGLNRIDEALKKLI